MRTNVQLDLAKPFAKKFIKDDGRGNSYVEHGIVLQRLILASGAPPKLEILRELYDGAELTGVLMRMTVAGLEPVEEFGEADNPQAKTNGARAKSAASDAIKRCAMRLGCGLGLWVGDNFFLHDQIAKRNGSAESSELSSDEPKSGAEPHQPASGSPQKVEEPLT